MPKWYRPSPFSDALLPPPPRPGHNGPMARSRPNVVFVFADQWRKQATGYAGNPTVKTPHLDRLRAQSVSFPHAVAGCPVCGPYRASLITGQYPLTHGVFLNDVCLGDGAVSLAQAFAAGGYDTAYVGKWHLDGHGRSSFIPRPRRQGFDFWRVLECTHDYNHSAYYGETPQKLYWDGYDAAAQTREAQAYLRRRAEDSENQKPFLLVVSWGPPHNPYHTAPAEYRQMYAPEDIVLSPSVPPHCAQAARDDLAGYYAHISALDAQVGRLLETLRQTHLADETVFVFTSDHGDMLGCHGAQRKQWPFDESILVPMLLRWPAGPIAAGAEITAPLGAPDIMPTLLGLCGVAIPETVEGDDFSAHIRGQSEPPDDAALIATYAPFGEWPRRRGGREYRGVRTRRYTYVADLAGPWLLFDNQADPYQRTNLVGQADVQADLERTLARKLDRSGDEFLPAGEYIKRWGYHVDETGTVAYTA